LWRTSKEVLDRVAAGSHRLTDDVENQYKWRERERERGKGQRDVMVSLLWFGLCFLLIGFRRLKRRERTRPV